MVTFPLRVTLTDLLVSVFFILASYVRWPICNPYFDGFIVLKKEKTNSKQDKSIHR